MDRNTFTLVSVFFLLTAGFSPSEAAAQGSAVQDYPYAYLAHVDGNVRLQRASEPETESATSNVPILPGDRVWTERSSRAEIVFADGSRLRLAEGTKVDVVELESETLVRLWSGSAIVRLFGPTSSFRIDSPAGSVTPSSAGTYRLDLDRDSLDLFVSRGSAELRTSRGGVLVQSGETSRALAGELPEIPARFNTARLDDFDRWSDEIDRLAAAPNDIVVRSLPHAVRPYTTELSYYGNWQVEPDVGYVWYPRVSVGWAPYRYGRWCNTWYGQTWVSYDPWGWAPHHYGRWGHHNVRGWYWIPGASFSPAWVSFAIGPFWVGWSPLGVYNRPVYYPSFYHRQNRYYRGGGRHDRPQHYRHGGGWNYVSRDHFGSRTATARLDENLVRASASQAELLEAGTVLGRDLTPRRARGRGIGPATEHLSYRRLERSRAETLAEVSRSERPRSGRSGMDSTRAREGRDALRRATRATESPRGGIGRTSPASPRSTVSGRADDSFSRRAGSVERPTRRGRERSAPVPVPRGTRGARGRDPGDGSAVGSSRTRGAVSEPTPTRSAPREARPSTGFRSGRERPTTTRGEAANGGRVPSRSFREAGATRSRTVTPRRAPRGTSSPHRASPRVSSPQRSSSGSRAVSRPRRTMSGGGAGEARPSSRGTAGHSRSRSSRPKKNK